MWILKTRPDLCFTVNFLARYLRTATKRHLTIAFRALRYLKGTMNHGIVFQAGGPQDGVLSGEADADLSGDLRTARSTSGYYIKYGPYGTIACSSSLERKISTSTGQAETYAMASLAKEVVWCRLLALELKHPMPGPTEVKTDNAKYQVNHSTAKHYRIAQAYIRALVADGTLTVGQVGSLFNGSDVFTKNVVRLLMVRHCLTTMGPQECPED
jgi:hypothetical protein